MIDSTLDPVNILLVDDRITNLAALVAILDSPDYHLVQAISGEEALKCLLKHDFAVVLLDVYMPEMDGFEVARLIKQRDCLQELPIIFLTAEVGDGEAICRGYAVGAVDYLQKPLDPDT